jgi:hypothetical protein
MKSKRAEQVLDVASFTDEFDYRYVHFENACEAVDLAEQDAEEEVTRYRTELEESKKREELARKVIDDQRKEMEKLKARAVEAFKEYMKQKRGGYLSSDLDDFIQKLNER